MINVIPQGGFNFGLVRAKLEQTKRELPIKLAKQAENHFTEAFTKGRLDDKDWKEVKRRDSSDKTFGYKIRGVSLKAKQTNPILVLRGNLRQKVSRSTQEVSWPRTRLVVDLDYAAAQNEGNPSRNLVARPYMVQTSTLTTMQRQMIDLYMMKIWGK